MARRRLTLGPTLAAGPVPRAEHPALAAAPSLGLAAGSASGLAAPIARVAAEAAGAAALQELADSVARARDEGKMVLDLPLGDIAPDHLTRDRIPAEDEDMAALVTSIRAHGQRTPIEVTPLVGTGTVSEGGGQGALPYGLISGWRRLAALKALHAETGEARFATVQALLRRPESVGAAYVAMVEENEIRVGLSHYERARVAALAAARGVFPDEETAIRTLFATASRPKRSRIRAFLELYHGLDGSLRFPAHLPERLGLALVERLRAGAGAAIVAGLDAADPATPEDERTVLAALVAPPRAAAPVPAAGPAEAFRPGVTLETRLEGRTLSFVLKGPGVTPALVEELRARLG